MLILVLLCSCFIFLFSFYACAKDDYYFIRRSITMEQLFNVLFIGFLWAYLSARLVYVLTHLDPLFYNPITFLFVSYAPGLSSFGAVLGLLVAYMYLAKRRKIHVGRFLDYVSLALLSALPVLTLGYNILFRQNDILLRFYEPVVYTVALVFFLRGLFPKYNRGTLREGSITLWFLFIFSAAVLVYDIIRLYRDEVLLNIESFLFSGLLIAASILLIRLAAKRSAKMSS